MQEIKIRKDSKIVIKDKDLENDLQIAVGNALSENQKIVIGTVILAENGKKFVFNKYNQGLCFFREWTPKNLKIK